MSLLNVLFNFNSIVHLWSYEGEELQLLVGHTNFVFRLAVLPTGEFVSASEDRTVKIWRGKAIFKQPFRSFS
jgi:WD40 repeat protein